MLNKELAELRSRYQNERDNTIVERIRQDMDSLESFIQQFTASQSRTFDFQMHLMITADTKEDFVPDYVTVAYGVNDWAKCSLKEFLGNCKSFFCNVSENYPTSKIFVITPIWSKLNYDSPLGTLENVGKLIEEQAAEFANISVIQGFRFVPQEESLFGDGHLHPNDAGFDCYFENLKKAIKAVL